MNGATPLERARREYHRIELRTEAHERILSRVLERTPAAAPSWLSGVAVGFAVGCAAIAALFAIERQSRTGSADAAVVFDIRGVVRERASDTDELKRVSVEHPIAAGAWIETHQAASLRVAIGPHRAQVGEDTRVKMESLRGDHLAFSLARGRLLFNVDPLPKGRTLAVRAGELVVEVVGTVFSVERNADCSAVTVIKGRVRTSFRGIADSVGAGEAKRYCEVFHAPEHAAEPPSSVVAAPTSPSIPTLYSQNQFGMAVASGAAAPGVAPTGAEPSRVEPSRAEPSRVEPSRVEPSRVEPSRVEPSRVEPSRVEPTSSVSRSLTDEERTFRRGIETLKSGGSVNARTSFEEYLRQYPNGTFSQDARFHLIRLVYAQGDIRQTVALGHEFLRISGDVGIRSNEVRLLVARGLMQQGNASDEAFTLLSPLMGGASTSREGYAEEIVYLYVLAAERTSRHGEARSWAAHYLHRYPTGRYVEEVTKIARQ